VKDKKLISIQELCYDNSKGFMIVYRYDFLRIQL